jgi:hypothetical protein
MRVVVKVNTPSFTPTHSQVSQCRWGNSDQSVKLESGWGEGRWVRVRVTEGAGGWGVVRVMVGKCLRVSI